MGRPRGSENKIDKASVREAWQEICREKPWLIKEALARGLQSTKPLGFLELGSRLMKEVGVQEDSKPQIAIIFNGTLDSNRLKDSNPKVKVLEVSNNLSALPALEDVLESEAE